MTMAGIFGTVPYQTSKQAIPIPDHGMIFKLFFG
jgi:hypothetical protein